ncbi:unnamed protein product, partial [Prunus brigantina]
PSRGLEDRFHPLIFDPIRTQRRVVSNKYSPIGLQSSSSPLFSARMVRDLAAFWMRW